MGFFREVKVIAAACDNMGIGIKGDIPWRLRKEMAYFTEMTSKTKDQLKKNAVIMGRKTWESIPLKYKPLANRLNIVISNTLSETGYDGVLVYPSLVSAVEYLSQPQNCLEIEDIWIIGGSRLYEEAIQSPFCEKIYLTRVKGDFECDTFFPKVPTCYKQIKEDGVPQGVQTEKGISYEYTVLEKIKSPAS